MNEHVIRERDVLDALPRAIVVTDPHGRVVLWNRKAHELYGWSETEAVGRSIVDLLAPPDARAANEADLARVSAGTEASGDRLVSRRDGQIVRVFSQTRAITDNTGQVVAIVGISEDVSSARAEQQRARDISEHFRAALDAGELGTWRWHQASGETVWDERLEALFGLAPGEFDGTFDTYVSLLHPDDRASVLAAVDEAMRTKSRYRTEHRVVWPDGSIHWISGAGGVTIDDQGMATGTVGCVLDITEQVAEIHDRERLVTEVSASRDLERVQRERLEFLSAINDALNSATNRREVMRNVTATAVPRLGDWCSIHVLPSKSALVPEFEIAHVDPRMVDYAIQLQERFPYDPTAKNGIAHVIRTGMTEFYPDITSDVITALVATDEERAIIEELALRSAIAVPLIKQGRILGAMQFVMAKSSRRYTDDDVALAHTVAGRIASSLENHRLYEEQSRIASTLQRSLLPSTLPRVPGLDIAVRYWAAGEASEVGGDFYDIFALDAAQQWAIVIGDVCGTGPAAAALTGLARHTIRASAWHADSPVEILTTLNRAIQRSETNSFLTAAYAVVTTTGSTPTLTIANAGHPLPIFVSADGTSSIGTPGTLLGLLDTLHIDPVTVDVHDGDVVVFYTDGATDVPRHSLNEQEWRNLVTRAARSGTTSEQIADNIRDALEQVLPFDQRNDDIALLIIKAVQTPLRSA